MDVEVGRSILCAKDITSSGIMVFEEKDGQECQEHSKNWALCHFLIEGTLHPELTVVPKGLPCFVCHKKKYAAIVFLYDTCQ